MSEYGYEYHCSRRSLPGMDKCKVRILQPPWYRRLFHRHHWTIAGVEHVRLLPRDPGWRRGDVPAGWETQVLWRCAGCERLSAETLQGRWTYEQLTFTRPPARP